MIDTSKLKGRITEKNYTIQKLAKLVNLTNYTLGKQISNKSIMNLETSKIIVDVLEIPNEEIADFFYA